MCGIAQSESKHSHLIHACVCQAGLCRTLRSSRCWGSENGEEFDSPSSFFPRCFDLSDLAQVDEFKDDFRQTAAEAVLKVGAHMPWQGLAKPKIRRVSQVQL